MKTEFVIGGLVSEAFGRVVQSYASSIEYYNLRVNSGYQPYSPYINFFDIDKQYSFICVMNLLYIIITMLLFFYMRKRKTGFRLRWILLIYDGINVMIAGYVAISILQYKYKYAGLLLCNNLSNDADGLRISKIFLMFYLQKYFEFFDTWFFILRKSQRQVTFLHLFHHSSITVVVGSILPFDFNGDMYLPILLNSANHTLIYLHYLLATLGLRSFWAPYITSMQLTQFCMIFAQSLLSYRIGPSCGTPDFAKVLMIVYMGSMIALFGNYFLQKYILMRPVYAVDMCGVIKRPQYSYNNVPTQYFGIASLDLDGTCTIILPNDFPDEEKMLRETLRHNPFCLIYSITPIGMAMPNLHISREVCRTNVIVNVDFKLNRKKKNSNHDDTAQNETSKDIFLDGNKSIPINFKQLCDNSETHCHKNNSTPNLMTLDNPRKVVMKSASFSDFQSVAILHNDRLIDGPLPLQNSLKQFSEGLSESINSFRRSTISMNKSVSGTCNTLDGNERNSASNPNKITSDKDLNDVKEKNNNLIPLSFCISGGVSLGKINWILQTVPISRNRNKNSGISVPVGTTVSGIANPTDQMNSGQSKVGSEIKTNQLKDWREIS